MTKFSISLSLNAIELIRLLFLDGPIWDGDLPSKSARDELVKFGIATRIDGWQYLNERGMLMAIEGNIDREKINSFRQRRQALHLMETVKACLMPSPVVGASNQADACCNAGSNAAVNSATQGEYMTASEIERRAKSRAHADLTGRNAGYDYAEKERHRIDG